MANDTRTLARELLAITAREGWGGSDTELAEQLFTALLAELDAAEVRVAVLEAALRPFAHGCLREPGAPKWDLRVPPDPNCCRYCAARAALANSGENAEWTADHIADLFALIEQAGGTITLDGVPIAENELRQELPKRIIACMANAVVSQVNTELAPSPLQEAVADD